MLRKIKNVVIGFFCFLIVSVSWLSAPLGFEEGGANMNKMLAFGLWILSVYLIIKGKAIIATVGTIAILLAIIIPNGGIKFNSASMEWEGLWEIVATIFGIFIVGKFIADWFDSSRKASEEIGERQENARKKGMAYCPECGSTSIQYYPLGVPYKDTEYNEFRDEVVEVVKYDDTVHYHCNNCGRQWY